jgi:hypothetical protein
MTFEQALEWMRNKPNSEVQSMQSKRIFYWDAEIGFREQYDYGKHHQKATFYAEELLGYWKVVGKKTVVVIYANAEGKIALAIKGSDFDLELAHEASHIAEIELGQG